MTEAQAATTRFCARIIGPLMLIVGAVILVRFDDLVLMMPAFLADEGLTFATGLFTLIVGLVLFAAHHHWSGPAPIVITIIGVLTILRGVLLMTAPGFVSGVADQLLSASPFAWIAGGVALLLGGWLAYAGWLSRTV